MQDEYNVTGTNNVLLQAVACTACTFEVLPQYLAVDKSCGYRRPAVNTVRLAVRAQPQSSRSDAKDSLYAIIILKCIYISYISMTRLSKKSKHAVTLWVKAPAGFGIAPCSVTQGGLRRRFRQSGTHMLLPTF
jgi:hypothetical protein